MNNNLLEFFKTSFIDIFEDKDKILSKEEAYLYSWKIGINSSDSMLYPEIKDKRLFRNNFKLKENEELIYCRDTSSYNTRNQGLVITNHGIRVINDKNNPNDRISIEWNEVEDVTYKDDLFFFWYSEDSDENDYVSIPKSFFYKDAENAFEETFIEIAKLFKKMADIAVPQTPPGEVIFNEMWEYSEKNPKKAWQIGIDAIGKYSDWDKRIQYMLGYIAYFSLDDEDKAWKMLRESLKGDDLPEPLRSKAYFWCADILSNKDKNNPDIRKFLFYTAKGDRDTMYDDNVLLYEQSQKEFRELEKEYFTEKLAERPYVERKLIFPVNNLFNLSTISQDQVMPVELDSLLANSNLQFPLTHPQANQLYVAHPYNSNVYLLYDNYDIEILQDKLREFSEIAQALGATEIDVKVIRSQSNCTENKGLRSWSGRVEYGSLTSIEANQDKSYSRDEEINFEHMFNRHQTFAPKSTISEPKNTLWLQGEPSWQRLIKQRIEGGLMSHREIIETKSSRVISGTASNQLKGEIESIFADLKLNWNKNEESRYSEHSNLVLSVNIKFSNMQPGNQILPPPVSNSLTTEELEYKEEYEACLANGEIAASERRLLDRLASKLGLSPEQVKRIEESAGNPLTNEEKEYLEEYRACLADDPKISSSTRRLLSKMAKSLGLTEEQVNKLENLK